MEFDSDVIVGLITAVAIPITIWGYKMFSMVKTLLMMHEDPEKYEFGTEITNKLVEANTRELRVASAEQTRQLKDLVYYTKAMVKIANKGEEVPPREPDIN